MDVPAIRKQTFLGTNNDVVLGANAKECFKGNNTVCEQNLRKNLAAILIYF